MGDTVGSLYRQAGGIDQHWKRADLCRLLAFWRDGYSRVCAGCTGFPDKTGVSKGASLWHTALFAKCSVLYLLSRLAGKMRVSPDGNARFARQENGQVFANGDEQKTGRFREWQQVYNTFTAFPILVIK